MRKRRKKKGRKEGWEEGERGVERSEMTDIRPDPKKKNRICLESKS